MHWGEIAERQLQLQAERKCLRGNAREIARRSGESAPASG